MIAILKPKAKFTAREFCMSDLEKLPVSHPARVLMEAMAKAMKQQPKDE